MHSYEHGGVTVRSHHLLADYMPALAVRIATAVGAPYSGFVADVMDAIAEGPNSPFAADMKRPTRNMRAHRLLAHPVQVGDVLLRVVHGTKTRAYEKVVTLVTSCEPLPAPDPALRAGPRGARASAASDALGSATRNAAATLPPGPVEQMLAEILARLRRLENPAGATSAQLQPTSLATAAASCAPAPLVPSGVLNWPPDSMTSQWHARHRGPRLSRPLFAMRVETYEEDQARALAALGRPAAPRGPLAAPEWSLADCAARAARCYVMSCEIVALAGLPPLPDAPPPTDWHDMGACLTWTDAGLMRLLARHPGLWTRWVHPELVEPTEDER